MNLTYVPLIGIMRELHRIPRGNPPDFNGLRRFRQYLRTIFPADDTADQLLPLIAMNPMGKDHVTDLLETLLAIDADSIAAAAVSEASEGLRDLPGEFNVGLVIADDLKGTFTNRFDYEFSLRFGSDRFRTSVSPGKRPAWLKDEWITCTLWSSEAATEKTVRESVLTAIYRTAYRHAHGPARTLGEMLAQEGLVLAMAGCTVPCLDEEELTYTREVLTPFLNSADMPTSVACLFGDIAARSLGFAPFGLSPWAGLALALEQARRDPRIPPGLVSMRSNGK